MYLMQLLIQNHRRFDQPRVRSRKLDLVMENAAYTLALMPCNAAPHIISLRFAITERYRIHFMLMLMQMPL